jgi:hypothetical protein
VPKITPLSIFSICGYLCAQGSDLAPIFGDLSQSEKRSEIKPLSVYHIFYSPSPCT